MPRLTNYIKKLCVIFEIMRVEIPMSRFGDILAAIDVMISNFPKIGLIDTLKEYIILFLSTLLAAI